MDAPPSPRSRFRPLFSRWARRVRARLGARQIMGGATIGLLAGAVATAALWQAREGDLRPWAGALGAVGAAAGLVIARRRSLRDEDVALYLDRKLGAHEAIATALELDREGSDSPALAVVVTQAVDALEHAPRAGVAPRALRLWHLAAPIAIGVIGAVSVMPLPPAPPEAAAAPGTDKVTLATIAGLEKVVRLAELDARDDAQRERLDKLAEEAKQLREKLRKGIEKREARADIAKLADGIVAERLSFGDGEEREGLESALAKLAKDPALKDVQKALGDRDMTELDRAMAELADKLESADRERAKEALEEAAEAAENAGAPGVAEALREQKKRLEERAKRAEMLRDIAKAFGDGLSDEAKEALDAMNQGRSSDAQEQLSEALEDALSKLTAEQRKQLAEAMKKRAGEVGSGAQEGAPMSEEDLQKLADQLSTPEGLRQLTEQLKQMAKEANSQGKEAKRQGALEDAERGLGEAESQMGGGTPIPLAGGANGSGSPGGEGDKDGRGGTSRGGGPGDHAGETAEVEGDRVRAVARTRINPGKPMPGTVMGRAAGRPGETASVRGTGALGVVGPEEVSGVERSDVPEEYREQIGRYFEPR